MSVFILTSQTTRYSLILEIENPRSDFLTMRLDALNHFPKRKLTSWKIAVMPHTSVRRVAPTKACNKHRILVQLFVNLFRYVHASTVSILLCQSVFF